MASKVVTENLLIDEYENDASISFGFKDINVTGKIVKLDDVAKKILARFSCRKEIDEILLEALALSSIISHNFKIDGFFKLQIVCYNSIIKALLCNNNLLGDVNAYLTINEDKLKEYEKELGAANSIIKEHLGSSVLEMQDKPLVKNDISFQDLIGEGYMLFHMDYRLGTPYQALVALSGDSIEDSANSWFRQSEQIDTYIRIIPNYKTQQVVAILLQAIPEEGLQEEEKIKEKHNFLIASNILKDASKDEIINLHVEDLVSKLYGNFGVDIFHIKPLQYKCFCNEEQIKEVVNAMDKVSIEELRQENNGVIKIECSFCGKKYIV